MAADAGTEWPETLALDSIDFSWTSALTQQRRREFAVLVPYGHIGARVGRSLGHARLTNRPSPRPEGSGPRADGLDDLIRLSVDSETE